MPVRDRDANRHRRSEPFAPRPSDLIADRLRVLAAWALRRGATVDVDGTLLDGAALDRIAQAQSLAESELATWWKGFRGYYSSYGEVLRERERLLHRAIAELEALRADADARRTLRLCKLRRPPLAKVREAVEGSRQSSVVSRQPRRDSDNVASEEAVGDHERGAASAC
ncbi:MAG: hypothetical protein HYV09_05290 [Deltaproteobacteria bacterium]|nr:hypothetical protein [Deltaproteobacteria bacterium]